VVLDAFSRVIDDSGNPLRHRIEHNAIVSPEFDPRYDEVGVLGTIFGAYSTCFFIGEAGGFASRTPDEFVGWEWNWRRLLDTNPDTVFAWSADHPVFADSSPIGSLFGLVTRRQPRGDGGFCEPAAVHAAGAITMDEALRLMTADAAYLLFREDEVGSLTPGRLADLVILTDDPTAIDPNEMLNTKVIFTMVGGVARYCTDVFTDLCG
jgi:predicted amidohydrolase YtcJ